MNTPAGYTVELPIDDLDMANHPNRSSRTGEGPKPAEVRAAREQAGLTQEEAGALVHAPWHSWQKWETDEAMDNNRRMHPATWDLFQIKIQAREALKRGIVDAKTLRRLGIDLPAED